MTKQQETHNNETITNNAKKKGNNAAKQLERKVSVIELLLSFLASA